MQNRPEHPPAALAHRPFPVGDMIGLPAKRAVTKMTELLTIESDQECRTRLRWMRDINYEAWATQAGQQPNAAAIATLTYNWDAQQSKNNEPGLTGYFTRSFQTSIGFIAATNFLPLNFRDYSAELHEMGSLPLSELSTLVGEAERSMRSHRNVHEVLPQLANLQAMMYGVSEHDTVTKLIIQYGTYLPYILSSISQLEQFTPTHLSDQQLARFIDTATRDLGM